MPIELACTREMQKPWGVADLRPWSEARHAGRAIGEICFERSGATVEEPELLLKVLLTSEPLSIQVHPDDAFAQSLGLPRGKTEAWYVLSARPGAAVALGLKRPVPSRQLRQAVADGSIADLVAWRTVEAGDALFVPAGTIHAIGPGLVIAEIQQRSDATFRLFDHGRGRELHVDHALIAAHATAVGPLPRPAYLTHGRSLLASDPHFVFERIELEPDSSWYLDASRETWIFILNGAARAGPLDVARGQAVFAHAEQINFRAGEKGVVCLAAYTGLGGPIPQLLRRITQPGMRPAWNRGKKEASASSIGAA